MIFEENIAYYLLFISHRNIKNYLYSRLYIILCLIAEQLAVIKQLRVQSKYDI